MGTIAPQITSLVIVYSTVYSDEHQRKHPSSASLAFVRGIHRGPVNSPHKWPVTRKMFPFDDVIMFNIHSSGGPVHMQDPTLVVTKPAGVLALTARSHLQHSADYKVRLDFDQDFTDSNDYVVSYLLTGLRHLKLAIRS